MYTCSLELQNEAVTVKASTLYIHVFRQYYVLVYDQSHVLRGEYVISVTYRPLCCVGQLFSGRYSALLQ